MFNDQYLLTQAVLRGEKTQTRRKFTLTLDKKVDGKLIQVYPSKVFLIMVNGSLITRGKFIIFQKRTIHVMGLVKLLH